MDRRELRRVGLVLGTGLVVAAVFYAIATSGGMVSFLGGLFCPGGGYDCSLGMATVMLGLAFGIPATLGAVVLRWLNVPEAIKTMAVGSVLGGAVVYMTIPTLESWAVPLIVLPVYYGVAYVGFRMLPGVLKGSLFALGMAGATWAGIFWYLNTFVFTA